VFEDRIGTTLAGKYRVERRLGEGGMGVVFEATHVGLEQRVAVKLLARHGEVDATARARFEREAKIAARLRNERIVRVSDVGTLEDGTPFLVMELLEGEDLANVLLRERTFAIERAVDAVLEVCDALADAHAAGIVHRDIKPSNLFVTTRPNGTTCLKILDFGISKMPDGAQAEVQTRTHDMLGSPRYMSPEQIASTSSVDARADVWSVGVVLFELLTGVPPFTGASLFEVQLAITHGQAPDVRSLRPDVPAALAQIIAATLARTREQRVPDVVSLADRLAPFASARGRAVIGDIHVAAARRGAPAVLAAPHADALPTVTVHREGARPGDIEVAPTLVDGHNTTSPFGLARSDKTLSSRSGTLIVTAAAVACIALVTGLGVLGRGRGGSGSAVTASAASAGESPPVVQGVPTATASVATAFPIGSAGDLSGPDAGSTKPPTPATAPRGPARPTRAPTSPLPSARRGTLPDDR
jgi:serine/threonine-protein kinase